MEPRTYRRHPVASRVGGDHRRARRRRRVGNGNKLQIDFGLHVLHADAATPFLTFVKRPGYYAVPTATSRFRSRCPWAARSNRRSGYSCDVDNEDCHLLVVDAAWQAALRALRYERRQRVARSSTTLRSLLGPDEAFYPSSLRGEQCTSADAAGFPIAAMLFTADEVAARRDQPRDPLHPAERAACAPASTCVRRRTRAGRRGGANLPPYGVRFRLRADFPLAVAADRGRARGRARDAALRHVSSSDGGNIALTARERPRSRPTAGTRSASTRTRSSAIAVTDMEVVDLGRDDPADLRSGVRNP